MTKRQKILLGIPYFVYAILFVGMMVSFISSDESRGIGSAALLVFIFLLVLVLLTVLIPFSIGVIISLLSFSRVSVTGGAIIVHWLFLTVLGYFGSIIVWKQFHPVAPSACVQGDCKNGNGIKIYFDQGLEKGTWKDGKLEGNCYQLFGKTSEFSGDSYEGEFKRGVYWGKGTYYDESEDSKYVGNWVKGKPNGKGLATWGEKSKFPGRYYDGEWKDGLMHGYGTKFWGKAEVDKYTNNKYTGEWKNDKMDGFGKYDWADGSYYEGPWKNDEQDGDGIYVFKDGEVFKGHWENGYCEVLAKKMGL